jgi:hypothetical protein
MLELLVKMLATIFPFFSEESRLLLLGLFKMFE